MNKRTSTVLRHGDMVEEKWKNVVVGDIIKMRCDQFVAVCGFHFYSFFHLPSRMHNSVAMVPSWLVVCDTECDDDAFHKVSNLLKSFVHLFLTVQQVTKL